MGRGKLVLDLLAFLQSTAGQNDLGKDFGDLRAFVGYHAAHASRTDNQDFAHHFLPYFPVHSSLGRVARIYHEEYEDHEGC